MRVADLGALEGVGADQLREALRLVRGGAAHPTHLMQHNLVAAFRKLPGRFAACEPAPDHGNPHASTYNGTQCYHTATLSSQVLDQAKYTLRRSAARPALQELNEMKGVI